MRPPAVRGIASAMTGLSVTITVAGDGAEVDGSPILGLVVLHDGVHSVHRAVAVSGPVDIGRDPRCTIVLPDPRASRAHAVLEPGPRPATLTLRDRGSRNGTLVDGAPVPAGERVEVRPGQVLRLGHALALVVEDVTRAARSSADGWLRGGSRIAELNEQIDAVAASSLPVLVRGETGSGKELVARALHEKSGRSGELVAVNCGALSSQLVESELFGHARGAFSGAERSRAGLVRRAEGGTLFLDEVAELPPPAQVALLRFLENGEVRGVGEDRTANVDVRVVSATHRDLEKLVSDERFRSDLLHRLAAFSLFVPPLAERKEDVVALAAGVVEREGMTLAPPALEALLLANWPGNVRELHAAVRAAIVRARAAGRREVRRNDFAMTRTSAPPDAPLPPRGSAPPPLAIGREEILAALRAQRGNVSRAAKTLGYSRSGLYSAMKRLGVSPLERGR